MRLCNPVYSASFTRRIKELLPVAFFPTPPPNQKKKKIQINVDFFFFLYGIYRNTGVKGCTPRMYVKRFSGNLPCVSH